MAEAERATADMGREHAGKMKEVEARAASLAEKAAREEQEREALVVAMEEAERVRDYLKREHEAKVREAEARAASLAEKSERSAAERM